LPKSFPFSFLDILSLHALKFVQKFKIIIYAFERRKYLDKGERLLLLGEKIAKQRKELKLSQAELAKDICTQATISKIEKRNIAPLTETLSAICIRLGLTLNDVMTEFANNQTADTKESMNAVKKMLAHYQFEDAKTKFSQIDPSTVPATLKSQYHSLQASIFLVCDHDFDNAIFDYGVAAQEATTGIDELIVDSGIGTAYAAHGDNERLNTISVKSIILRPSLQSPQKPRSILLKR
jgi:transcriptional regulator with XRE-family HTH domain